MRAIAEALGVSVATVSRALRHDPAVRPEMREAVFQTADEQGYARNAYLGEFMSSIRLKQSSKFQGNLGLLWGDQIPSKTTDPRLQQIQRGAREQAEVLNYSLSEFGLRGQKPESVARVLRSRGIRGILIAVPSFSPSKAYLHFDFAKFASVSIGWGLLRPDLHRVRFDYFHAVRLALHHARHAFGDRIAAVWNAETDTRANRVAQASFLVHHAGGPVKAESLFLDAKGLDRKTSLALLKKNRVECLIVEPSVTLPAWLEKVFPPRQQILFRNPGHEECAGWIDTQNILLGRWGVDLLTAKMKQNEQGLPDNCQVMLVPPVWMDGLRPTQPV